MKKIVLLVSILSTYSYAHDPYVAPLAYLTSNTQIPVLSGYAENAFNSEYALKDASFSILDPLQQSSNIKVDSSLKSATVFDLKLPIDGTYQISTKTSYPIKYAFHEGLWKPLYELSAKDAGERSNREYLIYEDFPQKKPSQVHEIQREWILESYVSKNKTTPVRKNPIFPIQVKFSVHPNEIKINQSVFLTIYKSGKTLKDAQVKVLAQGNNEEQAIELKHVSEQGYELKLPNFGQYRIEVTEKIDAKQKPQNQYYTIVTLAVQPE